MESLIRSLQQASGDVVVVATVPTFKPYGDIREYAVKMFENRGRGIGQRGKDNGLLVLLAVNDRQVWVEVGYDLEQFVTDGFAGETSRQYMAPEFRARRVRPRAARRRLAHRRPHRAGTQRHAAGRSRRALTARPNVGSGGNVIFALFVLFIVLNAIARTRRRRRLGGWGWAGGAAGTAESDRSAEVVDSAAGAAAVWWRLRRLWRRPKRRRRRRRRLVNLIDAMTSTYLQIGDACVWRCCSLAAGMSSGCSYNTFVSKEEGIKAQWAQVENQLQRRNDLIPNLVETTKGIAQQEKDVFGQIADSRAKMAGAKTPEETIQAANEQSAALGRLLVVVENYPQLRSSESFNRLMDELSGTENRIAVERMRYNERVQDYNIVASRSSRRTSRRASSASRNIRCSTRRRRPSRCRRSISARAPN